MAEPVKMMRTMAEIQAWLAALEAEKLDELEVDFRDPDLTQKLSRLRDPAKWAKAQEAVQQKARAAGRLEAELGRALEAILKKQPASPDVIFYTLASLASHYREQPAASQTDRDS